MALEQIYLARQPIVDRKGDLYGFELLFRNGAGPMVAGTDGMWATSVVVSNMLNEIGVQQVLGRLRGFLNVDGRFLSSDMLELLAPRQIVLEVLESTLIDADLVARCAALRACGFEIALDDYGGDYARIAPLLPALDLVKIDLGSVPVERLEAVCAPLRGNGLKLVAEKVETVAQFRACHDLGFDYFQGYHFARPELLNSRRSTRTRGSMLRLLSLIYGDAELAEIEEEFKRSPQLGYNLLRLVNSAAAGLTTKIASIKHGLVMLGRRQLQVWLQLLLYTGEAGERSLYSPLLQAAAMRGRLMENVAWHEDPNGEQYHDYAFMTGMLSLIDVLLGLPRTAIVDQLNLVDEVREALLEGSGRLGRLLTLVELLETERRHEVDDLLVDLHLDKNDLLRLEWAALRWANSLLDEAPQ